MEHNMTKLNITNKKVDSLSGLSIQSTPVGSILDWDVPLDSDYRQTEIWISPDDSIDNAEFLTQVRGSNYYHPLEEGDTFYYFIRAVNKFGAANGEWTHGDEAGTCKPYVRKQLPGQREARKR